MGTRADAGAESPRASNGQADSRLRWRRPAQLMKRDGSGPGFRRGSMGYTGGGYNALQVRKPVFIMGDTSLD